MQLTDETSLSQANESPSRWGHYQGLWKDNHGNLILAVTGAIFAVGLGMIAYRQNKFVPPRFPDARIIQSSKPELVNLASGLAIPAAEAIKIHVSGAVSNNGSILLAVYVSEEGFNVVEKAKLRARQVLTNNEAVFTFRREEFPAKFAIAAFHDENDDAELNRNPIGIPIERYGFSNDARATIAAPNFTDAAMEKPDSGSIDLYIR